MALLRILFIPKILQQISFDVAVRDLRGLIGHPVEVFGDKVMMLDAVGCGLLLRQFSAGPHLEEGMVLAVSPISHGNKLVTETIDHGSSLLLSPQLVKKAALFHLIQIAAIDQLLSLYF